LSKLENLKFGEFFHVFDLRERVKTKKLKKSKREKKKLLSLLENPCLSLPGAKKEEKED
jgi:hypothetical protein